MLSKFRYFIPLAIILFGLVGTIYLVAQQSYRQNANDPQIQIAEDAKDLPSIEKIEISKSLAPFTAFYDGNGKLLKSNATLDGNDIKLPSGIFDYVKVNGEDRVTWQPRVGVRIALVVVKTDSGFTASGRSLREVEKRIDKLGLQVGAALAATLFFTFMATLIFTNGRKK